ncbi:MAG: alpha-glucosidase, partial [Lachnospiraceae bacterium]|nr:alpha-glucosidase [Lachnospiraceae bacterium]
MIKRYRLGNPIKTYATVLDLPLEKETIPGWDIDKDNKTLKRTLGKGTVVYGLGETLRGINKRGWTYVSFNSDDSQHMEDKRSLYAAQNFFIIDDDKPVGYYWDTPESVEFDIGYTDIDTFIVKHPELNVDIYVCEADSKKEIVKEFRSLFGLSYIPPKWAFGYGQSRWSYLTEDEIRDLVAKHEEFNIPIDSVYLDIDYMDNYKDFTFNDKDFPNFPDFVKEMKEKGVHLVPIIDAGVKVEEGYSVYEEGVKNGFFCKKEDGSNLVAAVWPGRSMFPDFLNEEARNWFGDKYKVLLDAGIEGFWNDMNEPAIFYTEDHLKEVFEEIEKYKGKNLDIDSFFAFKGIVGDIDNNKEDYKRFYHEYDGKKVRHDKVHNLFGFNMTKAAGEAFKRLSPGKRILMFSRSSFIGMHRYGGIWTGDNKSWWSHLLLSIKQMPALNMCGFLYSGCDLGGFGADTTEDLMLRWLDAGIFNPLYRNHSAKGTRRQELYTFKETKDFKNIVDLRYAFIPYIYSEFMKAALNNEMYFMPLSFEYEDERVNEIEDQLLVGESIMIA